MSSLAWIALSIATISRTLVEGTRWRQAVELAMNDEEIGKLTVISRSRTEPASRVGRAQMLLAYGEPPSFFLVGRQLGVHHQTVQRCVERALTSGASARTR
jgi:hypothetical protein